MVIDHFEDLGCLDPVHRLPVFVVVEEDHLFLYLAKEVFRGSLDGSSLSTTQAVR